MPRVVCPIPETGKRVFNMGRWASYEAAKHGDFPIVQIGRRKFVVIAGLEDKLGLERGALDFLREEAESDEDDDDPPEPRRSASQFLLVWWAFPAPLRRRIATTLLFAPIRGRGGSRSRRGGHFRR